MNLLQFPSFSFPNPWNHEMVSKKEVYFTEGCESEQQLADYFTIKKKTIKKPDKLFSSILYKHSCI